MPAPPRFGDTPRRGLPPASAEEIARRMRRTGYAAALLVGWALAGLVAAALSGRVAGLALAVAGAGPAGLLALVLLALDLREPSPLRSALAAGAATLAVALAIAAHALHWGQEWLLLPGALGGAAGLVALVGILLFVPLYAGLRLRALDMAWRASGSRARGARVLVAALAPGADPDLQARPHGPALGARWLEGAALPGLIVLDLALRVARRPADRLHAQVDLDALAAALAAEGATVDRKPREIVVRLPETGAGSQVARVGVGRIHFPPGPSLDVRGDVDAARGLRRLLEGPASHALVFAWSAPARRWEQRLNGLHRDALEAASLEERSLVMEELDRVRRAIHERHFCGEERNLLLLKESRARSLLAHRMLSEPPGAPLTTRVLSHHAGFMPLVGHVLDTGGLAAVGRIAFVPHWILPVETVWGEQEVVVSAATGRLALDESRALLASMLAGRPTILLDVGGQSKFLPAPPPTNALLREMRSAGLALRDPAQAFADVVYVPYLATAEGYASGVTGRVAEELGASVPVAQA